MIWRGKFSLGLYVVMALIFSIPFSTTKMVTGPQVASVIYLNVSMHAVFWAYFSFFRNRPTTSSTDTSEGKSTQR